MSVFKSGEQAPHWCELEGFAFVELGEHLLPLAGDGKKQRLLVTRGSCRLKSGKGTQVLCEGQFCDLDADDSPFTAEAGDRTAQILVFSGRWGSELGGCGIFRLASNSPQWAKGDPVNYPKTTGFDSHFHDCDEYWVIIEGAGTVVIGSGSFEVEVGDCIAIGMGHHHDLPHVRADIKAAYFETTLEGKKRIGHLWNHKHGPADVRPERV